MERKFILVFMIIDESSEWTGFDRMFFSEQARLFLAWHLREEKNLEKMVHGNFKNPKTFVAT